MTQRVVAGRLVGTFGVRGELKCLPSRVGETLFADGRSFALGEAADAEVVTVNTVRRHHGRLLVALSGIETEEAARDLVGRELFIDRADVPLADDEYLDADLVGLRLIDESGTELGVVTGMRHYPAQDCLVVGAGALVPMVREFVRKVDIARGTITVSLPPGLLDPSAAEEA